MAPEFLLASVCIVHSRAVAAQRAANVADLCNALGTGGSCCVVESPFVVTTCEPEVVPTLLRLVDVDPAHVEDAQAAFRACMRPLCDRDVSNAMKHAEALAKVAAAAASGSRYGLVLEDDVLLASNFATILPAACRLAPPDADLVFMGLPSTVEQQQQHQARVAAGGEACSFFDVTVLFPHALPSCESYLVTPAAARAMVAAFAPLRMPTPAQLMYIARRLGLRAYSCTPNVCVDGSKIGTYASTVDPNNHLVWSPPYVRALRLVHDPAALHTYDATRAAAFEEVCGSPELAGVQQHPDLLALRARHLQRAGRFADALQVCKAALDAYDASGGYLSRESDFLRMYANLHGKLQKLKASHTNLEASPAPAQ